MKVGDLVVLSSYGKKRKFNENIKGCINIDEPLGVVVSVLDQWRTYPYRVRWLNRNLFETHNRKEIKYAYYKKR